MSKNCTSCGCGSDFSFVSVFIAGAVLVGICIFNKQNIQK